MNKSLIMHKIKNTLYDIDSHAGCFKLDCGTTIHQEYDLDNWKSVDCSETIYRPVIDITGKLLGFVVK